MTNLTQSQLNAVGVLVKAEMDKVLGRIKSLEDQVKALQSKIGDQEAEIDELKDKLDEQDTKNDDPKNFWNTIANNPAVKSGIINMVTTENNEILRKEKNLVIMEKKSKKVEKEKSNLEFKQSW